MILLSWLIQCWVPMTIQTYPDGSTVMAIPGCAMASSVWFVEASAAPRAFVPDQSHAATSSSPWSRS
jgi:hypothetical protein